MTRKDYSIRQIASRIVDIDSKGLVVSRDCRGYLVLTPAGITLLVLVNHVKRKGSRCTGDSRGKRKREAGRVAEIREARVQEGDNPDLLLHGSALLDAMLHPGVPGPGIYRLIFSQRTGRGRTRPDS